VEPAWRGGARSPGSGVTAVAAQVAGVSVHYGNRDDSADAGGGPGAAPVDAVHGVTVHRGVARSVSTVASAGVVQARLVSGVRVHVGGRGAPTLGGGEGLDAVVSDET